MKQRNRTKWTFELLHELNTGVKKIGKHLSEKIKVAHMVNIKLGLTV